MIDDSRVKRIVSEWATASILKKVLLKIAFLKFITWNLQSKIPEKYLRRKQFFVKLQVISL